MPKRTIKILGKLTDANKQPIAKLRVEAWDKDMLIDDFVGEAVSDEQGAFTISFTPSRYKELFLDRDPDIYFKIYDGDAFVCSTENSVLWNIKTETVVKEIVIERENDKPLDNDKSFKVLGNIRKADGSAFVGGLVYAYDKDLRIETLLGNAITNEQGFYEIIYSTDKLGKSNKGNADLQVRVFEKSEDAEDKLLAESEIFFNAPQVQEISLTLPASAGAKEKSEWERVNEQVLPLLKGQKKSAEQKVNQYEDLPPFELTDTDIDFIAAETNWDKLVINAWVASCRIFNEAAQKLNAEHAEEQSIINKYGKVFFYAITRKDAAKNLDTVLKRPAESWKQAISNAIFANRIPGMDNESIDKLIKAIELVQRLQQLDPKQNIDNPFARILSSVAVPVSRKLALDALAIVQEKGINNPDAVLELVKQHPGEERAVNSLVRSLRVNQLVDGHVVLFENLNARLEGDSHSIAQLSTIPISEWNDIAAKTSVDHATVLAVQVNAEKQHPVTALGTKLYDGSIQLANEVSTKIKTFIKNNEIKAEAILKGKTKVNDEKEETDPETILKNIGRFVRTGLNMELAGDLINIGIDTPALTIRYGGDFIHSQIREKYPELDLGITIDKYINTAEKYVKDGLEFAASAGSKWALPFGNNELDEPIPAAIRENLPTLPGLFGDMDECMCKPCESMLGQPAYLVDLLSLLKKVTTVNKTDAGYITGLDLLNLRRSAIVDLSLSCENAEKEIKHIDIVISMLEKAIVSTITVTDIDEERKNAKKINPSKEAYYETARAIYPWSLPFDIERAQIKANLTKLNITRSDLLYLKSADPSTDKLLVAETLDLSFTQTNNPKKFISEWQLITQNRSGAELWNAYGLLPDSKYHVNLIDPASSEKLINIPIQDVLLRISILLDRTGLDLDSFEEMIATKYIGQLSISNRNQCKTSLMRLNISPLTLEDCLNRIHRFVRLHNKLPDWSLKELDRAITACQFSETSATTMGNREELLIKLATIKRLGNQYSFPIEMLVQVPGSIPALCDMLGLTLQQVTLLKAITGLDVHSSSFNWNVFEKFCSANKRIAETGLTIEHAAETLLTRAQLKSLKYSFNEAFKSDKEITDLLEKVREHINAVVAANLNLDLKIRVLDQLTSIFGEVDASMIVKTISDAGAAIPIEPMPAIKDKIKNILHNKPVTKIALDESFPLLPDSLVEELLAVKTSDNPTAESRFSQFILSRLREKALITKLSELSELPETELTGLLKEKILLDDAPGQQNAIAYNLFLHKSFLADHHTESISRLTGWVDRLFRLKALKTNLGLENELLLLTDDIVVDNAKGINWRDTLATINGATGNRWPNKNWQAIEDIVWLQQPRNLSRKSLLDLLINLENLGNAAITSDKLEPLALRLSVPAQQVIEVAGQIISNGSGLQWLDISRLRKLFTHLMFARKLNVGVVPINQLADIQDNAAVAILTKNMLITRLGENEWLKTQEAINDVLRPQKRNALVALLIQKKQPSSAADLDKRYIKNANDLYEYYLIDPLMEPCMKTTKILEAITATQLFAQRILFGLEEGIMNCTELKQQWTWMRNYRVWEANRKVFLFPENWLYPELRDDKSSSFKQLESALGQGELDADLANEVFGQFLDDVAQMGQVEVLGMYEDVKNNNTRRDLYMVGRSPNPPYIYYWRKCIDFGTRFMEWSPWQRIELDIQGDHVMLFVLGGSFHIAWPIIKYNHQEAPKPSEWEVKLAWSRYDGRTWRKANISREVSLIPEVAFSDEIRGFSFRTKISEDKKKVNVLGYFLKDRAEAVTSKPDTNPGDEDNNYSLRRVDYFPNYYDPLVPVTLDNLTKFQKLVDLMSNNYEQLKTIETATQTIDAKSITITVQQHLEAFSMIKKMKEDPTYKCLDVIFSEPVRAFIIHQKALKNNPALVLPTKEDIKNNIADYLVKFRTDPKAINAFEQMYNAIDRASSLRNVSCKAWIKITLSSGTTGLRLIDGNNGSFNCLIGQKNLSLIPGRSPIPILLLGDQPALNNISLTINLNGVSLTSEIENLPGVSLGNSRNQTLNFLFDFGSNKITDKTVIGKFIADLGININNERTLQLASKFELNNDDSLVIREGDNSPLSGNTVENSLPWMNGYAENISLGNPPASNAIRISGMQVLETSPRGQFWAVGAATSFERNSNNIWHFSDSGLRGYVDLDTGVSDSKSEFPVYADSFKDAVQYRVNWSEGEFLSLSYTDDGAFSTKALFDFGIENNTKHWIQTHDKDLASKQGLDYESDLRFNNQLPYACYNWEVFFHAPLMVADQLSKQHKFEDAERWLRYIFDPTSGEPGTNAKRFLKFRVFREMDLNNQVINDLKVLAQAASGLATDADVKAVQKLIQRWREMPLRPFVIARSRQIAFLWRTLFAYLDNLLAWADSLYRRDTRESINEAVMIYVLAQKILGRRPKVHEGKSKKDAVSYNQLAGKWDEFANYWIDIGGRGNDRINHGGRIEKEKHPSSEGMLYFCMPFNDKTLNCWNTVDDRLFNIRHCRNIEGIERTLPLTDAPIDPELLIRAVNDGLNMGDVINGLYAPPPQYRYNILAARAAELCNETKALGAAMLSAIEKRDAEHLSLLRSTNEISLLKLVSEVKTLQITEAERNIDALTASRKSVSTRYYQYQRLLGKKDIKIPGENESVGEESMLGNVDDGTASQNSNLGLIANEGEQIKSLNIAKFWSDAESVSHIVASVFNISASVAHIASAAGGSTIADSAGKALSALGSAGSSVSDSFRAVSQIHQNEGSHHSLMGGHIRRRDEWAFQSNQTLKELQQIDKQILANKIRIDIAREELSNNIQQMEQAQAVDEVMRSKFSNEQLYQWMVTQLSGLYFSAYRMTLEMARGAQRAASRELGVKPLHILRDDYWDSLHMGLLAGNRLHQDLKRLEIAYLDQNRREYEMTKHISLQRLDPIALSHLRHGVGNNCEFDIPEWLFDLDTPGHYLRRIKSVSVSIPCIVGPYTSVNCKLTLLSSHIRHDKKSQTKYEKKTGDDPRFTDYYSASEAIVTSNANGDSGLFETQLRDERFLPFEGSGVISKWRLELPEKFKQFDYSTISDVILSIRYTARDGGASLKDEAIKSIAAAINETGSHVPISLKHDMPNEWNLLRSKGIAEIEVNTNRLPYYAQKTTPPPSVKITLLSRSVTISRLRLSINPDIDIHFDQLKETDLFISREIIVPVNTKFKLYGYKSQIVVAPAKVKETDADPGELSHVDDLTMIVNITFP
jgi:hypothetical protein